MRDNPFEDRGTHIISGRPEAAVLFLLHGRGGTRRDWDQYGQVNRQLELALEREDVQRLLVVMPDGHLNEDERLRRRFPDSRAFTQRLQEVILDVRNTTSPNPAALWAIAGVSMGAYQALEYVQATPSLEEPALFGVVGCFSPALSSRWIQDNIAGQLAVAREQLEYFIVWGSRDHDEIQRNGRTLSDDLRQAGVVVLPDPADRVRPGTHAWDSQPELWQRCLRDFLTQSVSPRLGGRS
jgi:enterochelin esterase-like enzyme